jgi:hypothetical protein
MGGYLLILMAKDLYVGDTVNANASAMQLKMEYKDKCLIPAAVNVAKHIEDVKNASRNESTEISDPASDRCVSTGMYGQSMGYFFVFWRVISLRRGFHGFEHYNATIRSIKNGGNR